MQKKLRNAVLICGTILGLLVLIYPFLSSMAQKETDRQNQKRQDQENALAVVKQNVVANIFYDTLQSRDAGWLLTKAVFNSGGAQVNDSGVEVGRSPANINLAVKKDKSEITVRLFEYDSEESAKAPLEMSISQAIIKECPASVCGDEGRKIFGINKDFDSLQFRKGRFFIYIESASEDTANDFAGYLLEAMGGR